MGLKLSRESILYKMQKLCWGDYLGNNLCPYFWRVAFSFLFVPFALLVSVPAVRKGIDLPVNEPRALPGVLVFLALFVVSCFIWAVGLLAIDVGVGSSLMFVGGAVAIFLFFWTGLAEICAVFIGGVYEKTCPIITWSGTETSSTPESETETE